eukprot:506864-Pyramimonas_sp.AAC.1
MRWCIRVFRTRGSPAGDHYHAWVNVDDLIALPDLLTACEQPLLYIATVEKERILHVRQDVAKQAEVMKDEPSELERNGRWPTDDVIHYLALTNRAQPNAQDPRVPRRR